ncbi:hypothetical protein FACS189426_13780 [Bacteroidia bacterium]|nr:hypothetical protein FACS189426_13780 [Bacteroidia bacterium]GHV72164.1 hypothetical protein FACS189420_8800 [Bacteroidia bacterium]
MSKVTVLFSGKTYDTSKQVLSENQIVTGYGYGMSKERYVVYRVENRGDSFIYHLINIETREFTQTDLPRPLSEKFGIGMYYNDETPEFMDAFEVLLLQGEAEYKVQAETNTATPETVTGDFVIADYSQMALAVFGDTRPIKDELKALGGRFNPRLTHNGEKQAGWIFSKSKEQALRNLLTIK